MKKYLLFIGILVISLSAYLIIIQNPKKNKKPNNKEQRDSIEKPTNNEINKITIQETYFESIIPINKELKKEHGGEYMVDFNSDSTILSLLNYEGLFNPLGENLDQELSSYIKEIDTNKISYKKGNSAIMLNYYINEMYGNTEYFMKGILLDKEIDLINNIHIGMSKKDFLQNLFILKKSQIKKLKQVSIDEDERGETNTQYRFDKEKLIAISFGNYDEYELLNINNLSIPKWLIDLYSNKIKNNEITQNILVYNKQNDSISYTIIEQVSNIGSEIFLITYKEESQISNLKLSSNIDADLGMSEYSYSDYKIKNNNYVITEIIETAIDSETQIKNEKTLDEVETKIDTIIKVYEINMNGKIELKK